MTAGRWVLRLQPWGDITLFSLTPEFGEIPFTGFWDMVFASFSGCTVSLTHRQTDLNAECILHWRFLVEEICPQLLEVNPDFITDGHKSIHLHLRYQAMPSNNCWQSHLTTDTAGKHRTVQIESASVSSVQRTCTRHPGGQWRTSHDQCALWDVHDVSSVDAVRSRRKCLNRRKVQRLS